MKQLPISPAFRLRWPLIILMGSIGLTALAAFDAQRTVRRQDEVVNRAIHEFSSFAAWSYGEHLKQQLSAVAAEAIGAVNHGGDMHTNPKVPDADELGGGNRAHQREAATEADHNASCASHRHPSPFSRVRTGEGNFTPWP